MPHPQGVTPRARRRRRWFVLLLPLASLLLAELGLRGVAFAAGRSRGVTYDARLGWRMVANVEKRGDQWCDEEPCRLNSRGFRDAEHPLGRTPGVRRIVALGDSMTFGANVDYGERFTEHLEDATTEVVNFGVCAWGTDQQLLVYEHVARAFRPDVVLLVVTVWNDLGDIGNERSSGWSKPYFVLEHGEPVLRPPPSTLRERLRSRSYLVELVLQLVERGRPSAAKAPEWRGRDTLPLFAVLVDRLADRVRADGAELLVVFERLDGPPDKVEEGRRMRAAVDAAGVDTFEVAFELPPERREQLHLPCGHWSPLAHRLVADQLRAELDRRGW